MKKLLIMTSMLVAAASLSADAKTTTSRDQAGDIVIANENVKLVYSGGKEYKFKEFVTGGKNILPAGGATTNPWQLTYLGPQGENPVLLPIRGEYRGTEITEYNGQPAVKSTWDMVLKENPEYPVTITTVLPDDADMPQFYINAALPEGWVITESEFPRIRVARNNKSRGILPVGFGTEYGLGREGQIQARYPSCTGTMQLVMMHDPDGTVFFAPRDTEGAEKYMRIKSEGDNVVFVQVVTTNYDWSKDGNFSLPWTVEMGYNPDTWQATALKWYRPWAIQTPWAQKPVNERGIAKWVENADMWLRPVDVTDETIALLRKALPYFGKGVGLHWYYWHHHVFDTHYPEYFPAKPGFNEMVAEAQKMGAYVTPYINGRLWDPATESYKNENAKLASCRKPDGSLYSEVYSSRVINTVTCPSTELWQNKLKYLNKFILDSIHTNGVYMDQIGCAPSEPCYASNHNHGKGGGSWWPASYRKVLTEMRNSFYKPNQAMTTEENAEPYMDLFDMMLVVNSPHNAYTTMIPLYPLIYSDRCVYSGYTYIPWRITDGSFRFMQMRSLLWGSQLGWIDPKFLMNDAAKNECAMLKNLADIRKANHDIFFGGRFMGEFVPTGDNEVVDVPNFQKSPVVLGAEWQNVKGKTVYVVANMSDRDRKVTLPNGKEVTVKAFSAIESKK